MCRSSATKVLPAMYIEGETELAFDDITPEDPDFPAIQGINLFVSIESSSFGKTSIQCNR